jgi:hypothetical protein
MKTLTIATIGDIQWSGEDGPTATDRLRRYIDKALDREAYFVGLGDYIDFMSPSNRDRLMKAGVYKTSLGMIREKAEDLTVQVYEKILKPTRGRWLGHVHGHHLYEYEGWHSDVYLGELLNSPYVGTVAFLHNKRSDFTIFLYHGTGGGGLPGNSLNKLYHKNAEWPCAEVYCTGHNTKLATAPQSRPFIKWGNRNSEHRMEHRDVYLVSCGGWSKSNIQGNRVGGRPEGDYAELAGYGPSPLKAPIITVDLDDPDRSHRTSVTV